jgi:hypothetical protein
MGRSSFKKEWGPAICMVLIEVFTTGQMLLTKVVVDAGLFVFALLTYRFVLGAVLVVPLAMILKGPSLLMWDLQTFNFVRLTYTGNHVFYQILIIMLYRPDD